MKQDAILIIGDDLRINKPFLEYIFESYEKRRGELGEVNFMPKNSKDLPFAIENFAQNFSFLTIFGDDEAYATSSKILATLTNDCLELKTPDVLVPKNAINFTKNSFLVKLNETQISLVRAIPTQNLGEILTPVGDESAYFCLFDVDEESAKILLSPLANTYDVKTNQTALIDGLCLIRAQANKFGQLEGFLQGARTLFSQKMMEGDDPIEFIAKKLIASGKKIAFAESCTAGLAAAKFARVSGVSAAFDGSLVTYANRIKHDWLGVGDEILDTYGAVSEQCVRAMLNGAIISTDADFALAISGIAGPEGGSASKPVGTVFVGAMSRDKSVIVERLLLKGGRNYVREQSVLHAFICLLRLKSDEFLG